MATRHGSSVHPKANDKRRRRRRRATNEETSRSFSSLPTDILLRISAPLSVPDLWAASAACRPWREALRPLREAVALLRRGKRYRHGRRGVARSPAKALESFVEGAGRGYAGAMVDAGLTYWEMGRREEAAVMCRRAAEAGHPAGMCNLGTCYLEGDPPQPQEAVKWFYQAAEAGYPRAQYNLALCLHRGRGVKSSLPDAAKWYVKAAKGGYVRAMYNASLSYSTGEGGLKQDLRQARMWMKCAAEGGHGRAQLEHGLELLNEGDTLKALVYLELAVRAGEKAAAHTRDEVLQSVSETSRVRAMLSADKWRPRKFKG